MSATKKNILDVVMKSNQKIKFMNIFTEHILLCRRSEPPKDSGSNE